MAHPLDGAFERVDRAGEQIEDLDRRIRELAASQQRQVLDQLDLGLLRDISLDTTILPLPLQINPGPAPMKYGVLVGETVYNVRAALDYLVYELAIKDSGGPQEGTHMRTAGISHGDHRGRRGLGTKRAVPSR
jgi:hypothetical protein